MDIRKAVAFLTVFYILRKTVETVLDFDQAHCTQLKLGVNEKCRDWQRYSLSARRGFGEMNNT